MTPIFQTRKSRSFKERGFTLLEVIITIGIMVSLVAFVAPKLGGRNQQIKAVVRKIGVLSREIRNQSKLQNATYRLVIDMNSENQDGPNGKAEPKYSYWVEKSPGTVIGDQAEEEEKAEQAQKNIASSVETPQISSLNDEALTEEMRRRAEVKTQ